MRRSLDMGEPPAIAAWRHLDARTGFEVLFLPSDADPLVFEGHVAAVEAGEAWSVRYVIVARPNWSAHTASVEIRSASGERQVQLDADGDGTWRVDGKPAPHLDGCLDVDLEASAFT